MTLLPFLVPLLPADLFPLFPCGDFVLLLPGLVGVLLVFVVCAGPGANKSAEGQYQNNDQYGFETLFSFS